MWVKEWHIGCTFMRPSTHMGQTFDPQRKGPHMLDPLLGLCTSAKMLPIRDLVAKVAVTNTTLLLRGESGVGKEIVAKAIHKASPRVGKQFLKVNCAALPREGSIFTKTMLEGMESGAACGRRPATRLTPSASCRAWR